MAATLEFNPGDALVGMSGLVKVTGLHPETMPAHAAIWEVFSGPKGPDRPQLVYQQTTLETALPRRKQRVRVRGCR